MNTINIKEFKEQFDQEYEFLYKSKGYVSGYNEAVRAFDEFMRIEANSKLVQEFVKYRGDPVTSDREAAAFMFTLSRYF